MSVQSLFATSLYISPLSALASKKTQSTAALTRLRRDLLEQCYLVRDTDEDGRAWSQENYRHGYTSYGSITDLHQRYPHFEELRRALDRHAEKFARYLDMNLQGGSLEMVSCWVNIMPASAAHPSHLHPLSVLSGTYYVATPTKASQIQFEDPRLSAMMAAPPKLERAKSRNQVFYNHTPKAGDVLIWESWLRHAVPPNTSKQDRVSISFNYDWK
jgi:uncharacterized protein (TIGR02466 family)